MDRTFRVCIDARLGPSGFTGGVEQEVVGLAHGLAANAREGEEYHFLVDPRSAQWLPAHLSGPCRVLGPGDCELPSLVGWKRVIKAILPRELVEVPFRLAATIRECLPPQVQVSDGTIERAGIDVFHQTIQLGFTTSVPTIYAPQDLQHQHLPELFPRRELALRRVHYPLLASRAAAVVALSHWGRHDIVRGLDQPLSKVRVIPLAPAIDCAAEPDQETLARTRERLDLPPTFALYPAQTWPHKNHEVLLQALAWLRAHRGLRVPAVFTGRQNEWGASLRRLVRELRLEDQVRFTGFVTREELTTLYWQCRMLVFPSRFEGFGMPVLEAFKLGVPVACSDATSLPEVAGGAAILFSPLDRDAMAEAIARVWCDEGLRSELVVRGAARVRAFTWAETARRHQALYRLVGGQPLDAIDERLLTEMA